VEIQGIFDLGGGSNKLFAGGKRRKLCARVAVSAAANKGVDVARRLERAYR